MSSYPPDNRSRVVITGVDIPFGEMVMLILKVMLASIPAYIILVIVFVTLAAIFGGIFGGMMGAMGGMGG